MISFLCVFCVSVSTIQAQKDSTRAMPRHAIVTTPLMNLINDSKPSFYYRLYLNKINDESKVAALRVGTELLSGIGNRAGSSITSEFRGFNIKLGIERGKRLGKSVIYIGAEYSYSRYTTNGAVLYPESGALFNLNNLVSESSGREESQLSIHSFIGFVGFRYELSQQFEVGIESALGYGWFENEFYEGNIWQFTPNRFIFLGYNF
jgi:hypothetical protein